MKSLSWYTKVQKISVPEVQKYLCRTGMRPVGCYWSGCLAVPLSNST